MSSIKEQVVDPNSRISTLNSPAVKFSKINVFEVPVISLYASAIPSESVSTNSYQMIS